VDASAVGGAIRVGVTMVVILGTCYRATVTLSFYTSEHVVTRKVKNCGRDQHQCKDDFR